jgi:hypothetical protein
VSKIDSTRTTSFDHAFLASESLPLHFPSFMVSCSNFDFRSQIFAVQDFKGSGEYSTPPLFLVLIAIVSSVVAFQAMRFSRSLRPVKQVVKSSR